MQLNDGVLILEKSVALPPSMKRSMNQENLTGVKILAGISEGMSCSMISCISVRWFVHCISTSGATYTNIIYFVCLKYNLSGIGLIYFITEKILQLLINNEL